MMRAVAIGLVALGLIGCAGATLDTNIATTAASGAADRIPMSVTKPMAPARSPLS